MSTFLQQIFAGAPPELAQPPRFVDGRHATGGRRRGYKLFDPGVREAAGLPLVVMLHGCAQDPDDFAAGTRMNELAAERGVFVLYPEQAARSNAQKCWNWFVPGDQRRGHGEPELIAGMTRRLLASLPVDPRRVYVAGMSAGGAMAAILGREYPELFAAVGVHSGVTPRAAHDVASAFAVMQAGPTPSSLWSGFMPTLSAMTRRPSTSSPALGPPVPTIVFHGDADGTVAPSNGDAVVRAALGTASGDAVAHGETTAATRAQRGYRRTVWRGVADGAAAPSLAEHWVVRGSPHGWSGGSATGSLTDPAGPDASREMLRVFLAHPRP